MVVSFFDDDEPPTAIRPPRESRPRKPAPSARAAAQPDRQQLLVRRGVAAAAVVVGIIVIVLLVSGCERGAARKSISDYSTNVNKIIADSNNNVGEPFFAALQSASGKTALNVGVELNQLRIDAGKDVTAAQKLSVPSQLTAAQNDLLLTLDLRESAVAKVAAQIPQAMGSSGAAAAIAQIAGQMEVILASDVIYSQRVAPLIRQELADNHLSGVVLPSRWLKDLAWLEPATVATRLTGVTGTGSNGQTLAAGTHGHVLTGVSVGSNTLATGVVNHIQSGANPTFTVGVQNDSDNPATNVMVEVEVTAEGKRYHETTTLNKTTPGPPVAVDVQLVGIPLRVPATVTAIIHKVPGEKNTTNNRATYTAIFS